jgi:4-amino-4-deoxy-L-arabinose transferase-like glycosyltransferase
MSTPLVLIFIIAWLVVIALALQWGFTNNWSDPNMLFVLLFWVVVTTVAAGAIYNKSKGA